ncbi:PREDICTED: uncharacterized protein LOC104822132 isoform X2 [Tarenaya hassleriana]|uniref:uncharacterized protein LOC104822132 isoform X2 n=1 Tax=Tarenaya hassleriana TaxID=28532 RepID=UPI00053C8AAF|nr:PREDICTED: uncharacterized protein LOC104822132 isoform X2 [Tarenaya hassleriana]
MALRFAALSLFLFFLCNLVRADRVLEDGYEVTTVFDGRKLQVNPRVVQTLPGSFELIVLDSPGSTFYTVSFPLSSDSKVKRVAGDGVSGNSDGEAGKSRFDKPRSFAVDAKGNIYVADRNNKSIRKISLSGTVTTIAGGVSKELGRTDGPAQNATFSNDFEFEITFVPLRCCLLISDHGNQLIRQINLKKEDCPGNSHSKLGMISVWTVGFLVLSLLLGIAIGIAVRPCVIPRTGRREPPLVHHDMEAFPNQTGETSADSLLRHQKRSC